MPDVGKEKRKEKGGEREGDHDKKLRDLRDRLYSRGAPPVEPKRNELPDQVFDAPHAWKIDDIKVHSRSSAPVSPGVVTPVLYPASPASLSPEVDTPVLYPSSFPVVSESEMVTIKNKPRSYRTVVIVAGLIFFAVALILSGTFLLFGKNMISGDNITITTEGPFAVGGGEELPLTVTIANRNAVPIQSATLIVEYPYGTQSADDEGKELFRERKAIDHINPGEVINIPLRARVFGEENEEKTVLTSIEYRVEGSNATFFKESDPLRFKISSSPVVLNVENVTKSASGQDVELKLTISSNASGQIKDLLVKAEYPTGFEFTDADPSPISERDTWSLSNLAPEEKKTITVKGILAGNQDETKIFKFSVGVPHERDRYSLASIFTTQTEEIKIEKPFLDLSIQVNGSSVENSVVAPGDNAKVTIVFKNSLSSTIYDGRITADLSGNGLDDSQVEAGGGFYDSSKDMITWDAGGTGSLKTIAPGRSSSVSFDITPKTSDRTPQITIKVSAEANRVGENQVSQVLRGTATRTVKVESTTIFSTRLVYSAGTLKNTGPVPPEAEAFTTYSALLSVSNGTNAVKDGAVTMTLPPYVTWLNITTADPLFSYNSETREIMWKVGDLRANEKRDVEFQVSLKPSTSQVGQVVNIIGSQKFRATDRFTGTTLRSDAPALTSQLFTDPQYSEEEGRVAPKRE